MTEKVLGLGGVFWRSEDPARLKEWYRTRLGVADGDAPWTQEAGMTVFEPFPATTDYFASPRQQVMFNFRVRDMDAMVAQLRRLGEEVTGEQSFPYGRFARVHDPEGNAVELWEPAPEAPA